MPPIAPPASADNATVLLWVVGVLTGALGLAVIMLWRTMVANAEACRAETKELHAKIDEMHAARSDADKKREMTLLEVVASNTQAMNDLRSEIGSGVHRALTDRDRQGRRSEDER